MSSPVLAARGEAAQGRAGVRRRKAMLHEVRRLLRLAFPIIVSQLGQVGMTTADTVMVGPLGATQLAAAGLGSAMNWLLTIVCFGTLVGLSPLVSQAYGARDIERCRRVLVQGLWLALLLALPVTLISLQGRGIALAMGQDPGVSALTGGYLRALAAGMLPFFLFTTFRQYLEGMGHVKAPMLITFAGLGMNILGNALLIYGVPGLIPALGVVGAGWATTLSRWTMLLIVVSYVMRHRELRVPRRFPLRPAAAQLRHILRVGLPVGGQFGLEVGLFGFAAVMMGWLGPLELAAHQVTINIASTTFMVALGVSVAGSIRVGHHIGAHRPRRMRRAVLATYVLATGFMGLCALAFVLLPHALIGLYTHDPDILALGMRLLLVAAAFQMFDGAQVAGVSVLRGAAETRSAAILAAIGYWGVGLPVAVLLGFPLGLGPVGIWVGLTVGLAVTAVLLAWRARRVLWHTPVAELRAG
jgi:MATE family multidrug resistance protein